MAAYDIFLRNTHTDKIAQLMIRNNCRLLDYLCTLVTASKLSVLEIGPGKGYFKEAATTRGSIEYYAVDRNENILSNLNISLDHIQIAELPNIQMNRKFDIIFVGYVIEHLPSGIDLYNALENIRTLLNDNGILVLQFPDVMKMGREFWNIDYTHTFPTTKRNVNQAILDSNMYVEKSIDICGILYTKKVDSSVRYFMKSRFMFFYSYKVMNALASIFYRVPIWNLNNVFWRAYGLLKEPNVMFIVKKQDNN